MKLLAEEPVLTIGSVAAAIVALLAVFGVGLETGPLETVLAVVIPLVGALLARRQVTPVASAVGRRR